MRLLKELGFTELNVNETGILVTNLFANYKAEAFYGDSIHIAVGIGNTSKTQVDIHYELRSENSRKEIARVITTIAFFDYAKSKVVSIPDVFLEAVNCYKKVTW